MKLTDFIAAVHPIITGGGEFLWSCYGEDAQYIDFGESANVIYDTKTQAIYEAEFHDYLDGGDTWMTYRWITSQHKYAHTEEAEIHPKDDENHTVKSVTLRKVMDMIRENQNG